MIIDSHVHLALSPDDAGNVLKHLNANGISRSSLMPHVGARYACKATQTEMAELLVKVDKLHPGVFWGMLQVNTILPDDYLHDLVRKYVCDGPVCGIKLTIQQNATDRRLDKLCKLLESHRIPVLWHSWYKTTCKYPYESSPADIACFARRYPGINILMAHLTAAKRRGVQDIKGCPNVWVDTSGSQGEDGNLEYALEQLGPDRVLFGSDFPCRDVATQLGRIDSVEMSAADREKVLCGNALKFFNSRGR